MSNFILYSLVIEPHEDDLFDLLYKDSREAKFALNGDPCLWESHENDLREFSKEYNDYLFTLFGEGDKIENNWIKYFKNGKMQFSEGEITFEDFDKKKLK